MSRTEKKLYNVVNYVGGIIQAAAWVLGFILVFRIIVGIILIIGESQGIL